LRFILAISQYMDQEDWPHWHLCAQLQRLQYWKFA